MKKTVTAILTGIGLFVFGCANSTGPMAPPRNPDGENSSETYGEFNHSLSNPLAGRLIKQPQGLSPRSATSVTELVSSQSGGTLRLRCFYESTTGPVDIRMTLKVRPGAVAQDCAITMTLDTANVLTHIMFGPGGTTFSQPALLDVDASGLDLSGYDNENIRVWYLENGSLVEEVPSRMIRVDPERRELKAYDVEINHFSQYAFGR